jgi:hypothetical protein
VQHANARLTPAGRRTLVRRIETDPRPIAHIAHEMGVSRATAYRWWGRYQQLGEPGLLDRPSIPTPAPTAWPASSNGAFCGCASVNGSALPGSAHDWGSLPPPCIVSWSATRPTG